MLCQQTCATIGKCTCGQWEAKADLASKSDALIKNKKTPKVIITSTPLLEDKFHQLIAETQR